MVHVVMQHLLYLHFSLEPGHPLPTSTFFRGDKMRLFFCRPNVDPVREKQFVSKWFCTFSAPFLSHLFFGWEGDRVGDGVDNEISAKKFKRAWVHGGRNCDYFMVAKMLQMSNCNVPGTRHLQTRISK